MLTPEGCGKRQEKLRQQMESCGWDLFLTTDHRTIYYLTGSLGTEDVPAVLILWNDDRSALVTSVTAPAMVKEVIPLEAYSLSRCITDPAGDAASLVRSLLGGMTYKRPAAERSRVPGLFEDLLPGDVQDASAALLKMRKYKEKDEIAEVKESLALIKVAYGAAREAIAPGLTEIDVYSAMYAAVVE